jgi:hypothetical protein
MLYVSNSKERAKYHNLIYQALPDKPPSQLFPNDSKKNLLESHLAPML